MPSSGATVSSSGGGNHPAAREIGRKVADAQEEIKFLHAWEIQGQALVVYHQTDKELAASRRSRIAKYVASTKEVRTENTAESLDKQRSSRLMFTSDFNPASINDTLMYAKKAAES